MGGREGTEEARRAREIVCWARVMAGDRQDRERRRIYGTYVLIDSYCDCRWVWSVENSSWRKGGYFEPLNNCTVWQKDQPVSRQSLILGNGCPLSSSYKIESSR